jgi:Xaa-Pro aminopeptidase
MQVNTLARLRQEMRNLDLAAYIVPGTDPHQSEYLPALWERRQWITGFTGSAGEFALTAKKAAMWTDSRYFLQADKQLPDAIELMKVGLSGTPDMVDWLIANLEPGDNIGIDPQLVSFEVCQNMQEAFAKKKMTLVFTENNLVDAIWDEQPGFPASAVKIHPVEYAGVESADKIDALREQLQKADADGIVFSQLDSIAWLFNIRGADVTFNPFVIAYAYVGLDRAALFVDPQQKDQLHAIFEDSIVQIESYDRYGGFLKALQAKKVWVDGAVASQWMVEQIGVERCYFADNPLKMQQACKNAAELQGIEAAHIRDGVAMVRFLKWFYDHYQTESLTELDIADKLVEFRREQDMFVGPSFGTIAGYAGNGAIVHYSATAESHATIEPTGILLVDSGGQYLDGTTDITRTIALGEPSEEQKDRFTRVLKGHIALATARFPKGTTGPALDTLARKALWDIGENYGHGTGHGVGAYLGVHEGPHGISYYRGHGVPLNVGMVTSNEPGYYKTGEYGIRIENLIVTVPDETADGFLKFVTITYCPLDKSLIDVDLLHQAERVWVNDYHRIVWEKLSPHLDDAHLAWLEDATRPFED